MKEYWCWLSALEQISLKKRWSLLEYYKTPKDIYEAKEEQLSKLVSLTVKEREAIKESKRRKYLEEGEIRFVSIEDAEYPAYLKHVYLPPFGLFVKGSLPKPFMQTLAVVGSRNCSVYGREMSAYFSKMLSMEGISIVSGLARGIDSYAHKSTIEAGGTTFAVLGCGIDQCYPSENSHLYEQIIKKGGVISEYPKGVLPLARHFPIRNRIISGMSSGILIVEAKERSGSLITAELGLEQGKNIYVIPGRVTDPLSKGCNHLIKLGAKLVSEPSDILEDYAPYPNKKVHKKKKYKYPLETMEKIVYASLSLEPKHIEQILGETKMNVAEMFELLRSMEQKGFIKETDKNYYVKAAMDGR